ncbi:helix-turn-helix domain-containing protein [Streptomyces zingiberis]|uniref:Helix-turn-helix domain-containing protein n=1 Tax=Streptomyces zingiberis TaxID=2053010 RepID=A0ABX1BZM7_9ACTN|nr:helix-turn-helix transcriptional regulator [Streptomyces zingiberis]NJQ01147.1 helix-turn-helix domain-containing protein [Streptomyces zingiberis]
MEIVGGDAAAEAECDGGGVGTRPEPGSGTAGEWEREPHPSDSLRTFGAVVQALREHAGLSRVELSTRVQYSRHTVESVELGRRMPDEAFVERAEEALGNTGALRKAARHLTRGEVGLAAWFRRWARLERDAVSLCTYECRLVPGLLQSEAYARAVIEGTIPLRTDEELEAQFVARMERQATMRERPTVPFSFIVEEHVFRRRFGDAEATRELIDHVLERTAPRNVTLQVVPLESGLHACLDGPLQVLETLEGRRLGYSEGQQNGRLISDRKEVSLLCRRYDTLRSQALGPTESRDLLERLRGVS